MIPCSDYPPTENGDVKNVKTMGRSEGGASEGCLGGAALANVAQEPNTVSPTPSDLAASSSSSPVSSSLVEEIWELIEDYVAYRAWPWAGPWQHAEAALRSRLTALETELNALRTTCTGAHPEAHFAPGNAAKSLQDNAVHRAHHFSPNTTEKL